MSGRERNNEKGSKEEEGGGGGWASTFWKVIGAAAAAGDVLDDVCSAMKQLETHQQVAFGASGSGGVHTVQKVAGGSGGAAQTNEGAAAVWTKPEAGWVKLNVDGSRRSKDEIPSAGCGGVLRDSSGEWMYGFAQKLSPNLREDQVEKEAILIGLQWAAHRKGVRKLAVESDNKGIVNKVNSLSRSTDRLICDIRELLNDRYLWQQATLTWIPGDANHVADKLADIARSLTSSDLKEIDSPPQNCLTALEKDSKAKEGEGEGGGWASTLLKIAGAAGAVVTAGVVAGELYSALKQPETNKQVAFGAGGSGGVHTDQEGAVWTKPMVGWMKLNVDGSLLPHIPSAGCGGVLRDSSGEWMDGFAQKLSPRLNVDETEKEAILKGLQWAARGKGVRKLAVESDNEGVVYTVNSGTTRSTDPLILEIRKLLNDRSLWEQVTLTSIRREANQVADKVASNSHTLTSFDDPHEYGPHSPPRNCLYALSRDAQ